MHSQLDTLPRQHLTDMRRTAERDRLARKAMLGSPQQASKQSDLLIATLVTRSLSIVRRILNVGKHPKRTQIARESVQRDRRRAPTRLYAFSRKRPSHGKYAGRPRDLAGIETPAEGGLSQ